MRYENAKNILPKELLKEVQKYAEGKILYIPSGEEKKEWGEITGYRKRLQKRNQMICNKYKNGITVTELSEEYYLSIDSIKKILYSKKRDECEYTPTVASALAYQNAGMIEEWIHTFLQFSCSNCIILEHLFREQGVFSTLIKLPLRLVRVESEETEVKKVEIDKKEIQSTYDNTPPLLILFEKKTFILLEQEEVFHRLRRLRTNAWPVVIWIKKGVDYELFQKQYGSILRTLGDSQV
ncbi:CD3324 family protein [Lachnoclostridium phytofermentans]|uniref:Uncharacterized protein n=1 Tax=Lachnoclostridium phytofermentans (strain ATCC 700394 / DSM 18823 / ISDg) TaxID=357809 RepID=A9KQM1_LACP7|nr:CD3324 family protein [Lachnoclostridium phytofermentans]ABX41934.1 hypothetical protein Cphy_1560 [Lachnoclostridium phytofermentans ISDg]